VKRPARRPVELEVVNVNAPTRESSRAGGTGASAPMSLVLPAGVRLAPLVAAAPSETISALAAAVVRAYERDHHWDDMSAEDVTVCGRFGAGAVL